MKENIDKDIINLSKGMRQKVLIIQNLMVDSDCYIFDEPLSGLDPISQNIFMDEINKLFDNKKLIIIITHFPNQYNFNNKLIIDFNKKEYYDGTTS
jgi:ABC-type multidrug transport system ATPase subunit